MTNNTPQMPMFIIEYCSISEHKKEFPQYRHRSLSLINSGEAYKDLSGTIHYSSLNHFKNCFIRSYSCPKNTLSNDISFHLQSGMNLLDPSNGVHSPAGSSSRYSLYGSFFDLSENSFHHPSLIKTEKKFLTINGHPLVIVDNPLKLYEDKCNDWLNHLDAM